MPCQTSYFWWVRDEKHLHNICICEISNAVRTVRLILFILRWHLCLSDGFACSERRFICQHLSGYGKCFELYYRSFRAAYGGFHFYCLEAGGGIIAPRCTGGSWGWRSAAAEGPLDYWPGVKFYPACFACMCQILYYPERWDVSAYHQEKACNLVFYCPLIFFLSLFILRHMTIRNKLIFISYDSL